MSSDLKILGYAFHTYNLQISNLKAFLENGASNMTSEHSVSSDLNTLKVTSPNMVRIFACTFQRTSIYLVIMIIVVQRNGIE